MLIMLAGFAALARFAGFLPLVFFFAAFFLPLAFFGFFAFTALPLCFASARRPSRARPKACTAFRVRSIRLWACFPLKSRLLPQCRHLSDLWWRAHFRRGCCTLPQ